MSLPPSSSLPGPKQTVPLIDRINLFFHYRRYIKMIVRRWFLLVISVCLCGGYQTYKAIKSPDIFRATSSVELAPRPQVAGTQMGDDIANFYEKQISYLKSAALLKKVYDRMNQPDAAGIEAPAPITFQDAVKGKGVIYLLAESPSQQTAQKFVREWAREFLVYKRMQNKDSRAETIELSRKDEVRAQKRLEQLQAEIAEFVKSNKNANIESANQVSENQLRDLQTRLLDIRTKLNRLEKRTIEELAAGTLGERRPAKSDGRKENDNAETLDIFDPSSTYPALMQQLKVNEADVANLTNTLKPRHPYLLGLMEKNRELKGQIQAQLEILREKLKNQVKSLKEEEESYAAAEKQKKEEILNNLDKIQRYKKLTEDETTVKRDLDRARAMIQELSKYVQEAEVFRIIEEGVPLGRVAPNRSRMVLTGLVFGVLIGIGLIYFLDRLDDRLELAEEIEGKLEQPVLGQIPQVAEGATKGQPLLLTKLEEHNVFSESVRGVRSAVMLGAKDSKNVLLVTSAVPGDGKTTFTVNFAVTLAIANHRVLLVDADLRRGNTHNFFGNNRAPGFSEVLLGELHWTDVLRQTEIETLKVIHSGRLPSNPGELMISPITKEFLQEVLQDFDYVVFDCPPLTAIDDTFTLLPLSTGLIFVVRSGQTSMRFAKNAITALKQRGARLLGLVVNGITPDNPYYYYQHYYHGYYTRQQKESAEASDVRNSPMPGTKMATPKRSSSTRIRSIEAEAHGVSSSSALKELAAKERQKAEVYKARRQSRQLAPDGEQPAPPQGDPS